MQQRKQQMLFGELVFNLVVIMQTESAELSCPSSIISFQDKFAKRYSKYQRAASFFYRNIYKVQLQG